MKRDGVIMMMITINAHFNGFGVSGGLVFTRGGWQ